MTALFDPIHLGCIAAANRIVMAPLTRNRAGSGGVPPEMAALLQLWHVGRISPASLLPAGT